MVGRTFTGPETNRARGLVPKDRRVESSWAGIRNQGRTPVLKPPTDVLFCTESVDEDGLGTLSRCYNPGICISRVLDQHTGQFGQVLYWWTYRSCEILAHNLLHKACAAKHCRRCSRNVDAEQPPFCVPVGASGDNIGACSDPVPQVISCQQEFRTG